MKSDKSSTSLMNRKVSTLRKVSFSKNQLERDISEGEFTMASAWKNFKNFTTSHGIAHIDHAKGKFKKSVWVFFTVLCFVGLCFNLFLLISKYLEYNVDVSIKIEQAKAMAFPAVTICNNNPIKKSYFDEHENFKKILIEYRNEVVAKNCSLLGGNLHTPSLAKRTSMAECFPTFGLTEDGRKQRSDFRLLNLIQESLISMEESQTLQAGHDKYDMIFDCEFSGGMCDLEEDFTYSFNNYYGNCYTFNSVINSNGSKMSRRAGPRYGLSITFNVEQHEYVGEISQSAGLRVVVHDPMRMPFPEDDAILVSPNALTHIGVTMVKNMKLNGSYGNCYAEGLTKRTVYQEMFNLSYCEKGCQYTCLSKEIIRRCLCCYAKFAITKNRDQSLKPCAQDNDTQRMCVDSVWTSYENGQLQCDPKCPIPCRETLFKVAVSSDIWPSKSYLTYLRSFLRNSVSDTSEELDNYGKFVVYIENLAYESISETPAYEVHQLLSDIGGVLGLYIGFSLLTLVEFLELLYDMCRVAISLALKNFYKRTKRPPTSPKI